MLVKGTNVCNKGEDMPDNENNKTVKVHYTGSLADGTVFVGPLPGPCTRAVVGAADSSRPIDS